MFRRAPEQRAQRRLWRDRDERSDAKWQQVEDTASLERPEGRPNDEQRGHRESQTTRVRKQREQQRAEDPLTDRPFVVPLDLRARVFDQRTVLNARGARG